MLQRVQKHCVSFFKLYTSKIPWSNHQLINVLVVSDWGKTLRYLSPKAFSPPALTLLQQTPPASVPSEVLWFIPIALIFLEKCSPLAMTFTADHQQLRNSPHTLRLQKSPSKGFTRLARLLFGASHEHSRLLALPRAILQWRTKLQFRHTKENRAPEKMWS